MTRQEVAPTFEADLATAAGVEKATAYALKSSGVRPHPHQYRGVGNSRRSSTSTISGPAPQVNLMAP